MKIELKNVKHAKFASQETDCFEATVLIDGKVVGRVSNEGHGGNNRYEPFELESTLTEYGETLPKAETKYGSVGMDADLLIGEVFNKWLAEKDLKRMLKSKIVFLRGKDIYSVKTPNKELVLKSSAEDLAKRFQADKILNLLPFTEALTLFDELTKG